MKNVGYNDQAFLQKPYHHQSRERHVSDFIDELAERLNDIDTEIGADDAPTSKREAIYYALDGHTPTTEELAYCLRQVLAIDLGRTFHG
jgi:hypothetical protein